MSIFSNKHAYIKLPNPTFIHIKRWRITTVIKYLIPSILLSVFLFFVICELQLNLRIYARNWISHADDTYYKPLSECYHALPEDSPYLTNIRSYHNNISPGISLMEDYDCYDFAATIRPNSTSINDGMIYHAYWRADLAPLGPKQLATLRSFFATQDNGTILYLWSNGNLSDSAILKNISANAGSRLVHRVYDPHELSQGSPMENSAHLEFKDNRGYLDGDLIRLLAIYRYGGMWFDMDSLFIRDMSPLFEHEWLSQWDCFLPNGFPFNGAFMHFHKRSYYLCEMLTELASGPLPRPDSIDWGGYMYYKVFRRLLFHGVKPWAVLPWCFVDSMVCSPRNSMPNAFVEAEFPHKKLLQVFAYHWHNQWKKEPGSLFRFLETIHRNVAGW